ncbi:hypothetical protein [Armatimonas sp.]|uniref:hypothetical protein n=1 Tax=Armatimonas sp. TaxID=1872638 RepID=UPI00286B9FD2|nr:hypothetical protein [Armatimonas sp.]
MIKRRNLLKLALALPVTTLAGCGSGWNLGFGPLKGGGGGDGATSTQRSTGRVILPTGSPLSLGQLQLLSGYTAAELKGDGSFTLEQFNATPALLLLTDKDKRLVLLGFSGSTASGMVGEVSPLQTAIALLFYAVGAFTLPTEAQERVRVLLREDERVKVLASQITTQLAANPYALANSDPALFGAVTAVRDALVPPTTRAVLTRHRADPLATTLIQTSPENEQSGFLAAPNASGLGMTITNTRRRNAIVNIYESAYKTEASTDPVPVPDSKYHRIIYSEILWGTSGLSGVAGTLIDYAAGSYTDPDGNVVGGAYVPVKSGPYSLDLFPSEATRATYRVEIIANGNGGDPNNLTGTAKTLAGDLTPLGAHVKISFITFFKDFLLPTIATFSGLQGSLQLDLRGTTGGYPSSELLKNFDDLALILSGVVDSGIAINAGNARSLLITVLKALANNGTLRQKFIEWMVVLFARKGFTQAAAGVLLGTLATALNAIVIVVDKVLGAADIGAVLADWARSDSYVLFEATVIAARVKLTPLTSTLKAGDPLPLRASTTVDAPVITYHWRIVTGSGTLKNPASGLTGVSLDSASQDMIYQSDANAADKETVTIELEGFVGSVNDPNRSSIGKINGTVTISKPENLIKNGDFSAGMSDWKQVALAGGSFGGYPKFQVYPPWPNSFRAGNDLCNIHVPGSANAYISQTVTLPDRPMTLSLVAWNNIQPASLIISVIQDGAETILGSPSLPSIVTLNGGYHYNGGLPVSLSYPLDAFKGKTIEVRFRTTAAGYDGTVMSLDDIAIR